MPGYWNAHSDRDWEDQCGMYDEPDEGEWDDDDDALEDECGRWENAKGGLSKQCRNAGTEFCDFMCPLRDAPMNHAGLLDKPRRSLSEVANEMRTLRDLYRIWGKVERSRIIQKWIDDIEGEIAIREGRK